METIKNPRLTSNSKVLRKNMTKQERHLWYDFLKQLPVTVHRQKVYGPFSFGFLYSLRESRNRAGRKPTLRGSGEGERPGAGLVFAGAAIDGFAIF